jgi:hypothetical protein
VIDISRPSSDKCPAMDWAHYMLLPCSPSNTMPKAYVNDSRYYNSIVGTVCGTLSFLIFLTSHLNPLFYCYLFIFIPGIVVEKMLHLSLAGNTLCAVGSTLKLYDLKIILSYLMLMPGLIPNLKLNL